MIRRPKKTTFGIAALLLAAVLALGGGSYIYKQIAEKRMLSALATYGFNQAALGSTGLKGRLQVFQDISLDPEGFSTIETITARTGWDALIAGGPLESITIDNMVLSGEIRDNGSFDIAGWKKQPLLYPRQDRIVLNSGQLDIMTPIGALRFEAKGQTRRQDEKTVKVQAAVWGTQKQVELNTHWDGFLYSDGGWTYEVEINDAGLNTDDVILSRANGWLTLDKKQSILPLVSGQLALGKMQLGALQLSNVNLTVEGPVDRYHLIMKGNAVGFEDLGYVIDVINQGPEGPAIDASITSPSFADIASFIVLLQDALSDKPFESAILTPLLLTEGNIDRLKRQVDNMTYDMLELKIAGPAYDLGGKIVAIDYKDGISERSIISLDPGTDPDNY